MGGGGSAHAQKGGGGTEPESVFAWREGTYHALLLPVICPLTGCQNEELEAYTR